MDSQEFFGTLLPIQKEDEQKYIAYIFKYPEETHVLHVDQLYDDVCKRLYVCIESIVKENLKLEKDILYAYAQKVDVERTTIDSILLTYTDFDNIKEYTIKRIRDYHTQKQIIKDIDVVIQESIKPRGTVNFDIIKNIASKIQNKGYELNDDSRLLTTKDLGSKYRQVLINRKNPEYRRTYGYSCIDKTVSKPAAPEEFTVIFGAKGSGKSLFAKTLENNLINIGTCVTSFNMEMSVESNMDRLISMRECIPFDIVTHKIDPSPSDLAKIEEGVKRLESLPNYLYYDEPSLTLADYDDLLYMAKKKFKENDVLPEDGYGISFVDLGSMIKEFSGADYRALEKAVNDLSSVYRKHKQHIVFILQANESQVRGGRRFTSPEQCDNFTLTYEDVFGGSSYAARARIMFAVNRPLLLKKRFMPSRKEEWDLEEDVMWVNVAKENDNTGKLGRIPFVFPDSAFRLVPKDVHGDYTRQRVRVRS